MRVLKTVLLLACLSASDLVCAQLRIAVTDFSGLPYQLPGRAALGVTVSDMLTNRIVDMGDFQVVERAKLAQLVQEKGIVLGVASVGEQVRAIGRELGADFIVVGSLSSGSYGLEVSSRLVEVANGEVRSAAEATLSWDPSLMRHDLTGLALRLLGDLASRGMVLQVYPDDTAPPLIMVDLGDQQGIQEGAVLQVVSEGNEVVHPVTGEVLGRETVPVSEAVVVQVQEQFCYARVRVDTDASVLEPLQRVRASGGRAVPANRDVSILTAKATLPFTTDIPGARVLVDKKEQPLVGGRAEIPLTAGRHQIELIVGAASRVTPVTVTQSGADVPRLDFPASEWVGMITLDLPFEVREVYVDGAAYRGDSLAEVGPVFAGQHLLVLENLILEDGSRLARVEHTLDVVPGSNPLGRLETGGGVVERQLISMIAFSSDRSGNWDIWVMYPDGTGLRQLTQGPEEDFQPTWSPDGSRIAFGRKDASGWDIWAVSPDGQECQKLADGLLPADWSPDGTRLAVENWQDAGDVLEEYDLATGVSTPLGSLPGPSGRGCYSPDGASLLFQAMGQHWEIWRVDFGSTPQRVLGGSSLAYADPAWSPDGQMMALCHHPTALDPEDVFVARPDGTGLRNVTQSYSSQDILPNWSPDGSQIVFVSNRNGGRHLFTVSPSGGPVTQLTSGACLDREPEWSPLFYPHERQ